MSVAKKYFYLKIKETFFDSEEMKILESMKNGLEYQNLYLKLCLLSAKSNGELLFKNTIPYDANMLSTVIRMSIDTVKTGIEIFTKLGLVEVLDNGIIFMSDIQMLVGSSTSEADRIMAYRKRIAEAKTWCTNVLQMNGSCTPELELKTKTNLESNTDCAETSVSDFDRWWDEYPKKVGRKPALDKWASLSKKKRLPEIEEHIGIIKKMKDSKQWENKTYIPNPSTWLNQERWNDEIPTYEVPAKPTSGIGRDEIDEIMGGGNHG